MIESAEYLVLYLIIKKKVSATSLQHSIFKGRECRFQSNGRLCGMQHVENVKYRYWARKAIEYH